MLANAGQKVHLARRSQPAIVPIVIQATRDKASREREMVQYMTVSFIKHPFSRTNAKNKKIKKLLQQILQNSYSMLKP